MQNTPFNSHEVDYEIFGDDMQIVEVELGPAEPVIAEAGMSGFLVWWCATKYMTIVIKNVDFFIT